MLYRKLGNDLRTYRYAVNGRTMEHDFIVFTGLIEGIRRRNAAGARSVAFFAMAFEMALVLLRLLI